MFKIGDFSKLTYVTVKTLRYYDELGLLPPAQVDRFTGYRYYSADQLPRLNRILALKDLGLSLEQIASLLNEELPPAQLRGMLRLKQSELQEQMREEHARLARVEARLKQIEQEGQMPNYEIVLKKVPPLRVASLRDVIPSYGEQGELWGELERVIAQQGSHPMGPCLTIYHDPEYREREVDAEVCEPMDASVRSSGRVKVYDLPGVETMASLVHHGSFETLSQAYSAFLAWTQANGYKVVGPDREIYLHTGKGPVQQDDPSYVTEIQIPVEKL